MNTNEPTPHQWAAHLRYLAEPAATREAWLGLGELKAPFRAAVLGESVDQRPPSPVKGEVGLWWARVDDSISVDELIGESTGGPLFSQGMFKAIEVWTEADLCGLHALWRLAHEQQREEWMRRVETVRDWHLAHTEPGNATNRPWALHVFVLSGTFEGRHYAETLLHNCMTMTGTPDPLSAWILLDAARQLESFVSNT